ncbi:MAG: hypothetical protein WCI76_03270 [bacterium]
MENNNKENFIVNIKKIFDSKTTIKILYALVGIVIAMLIFHAGVIVGFNKASYGHAWGQHYSENFGIGNMRDNDTSAKNMMNEVGMMNLFPNAHGAIGKIIKIQLPNIIVEDDDNTERVVYVDTSTKIEKGRVAIATKDLNLADFVVVIGAPNEKGVIEAKLIRVIPAPEFLQ